MIRLYPDWTPVAWVKSRSRRLGTRRNRQTGHLHEALDERLASGEPLGEADVEAAATRGAVQRLRPKLMTVAAVLASLIPILVGPGIGSDVTKPIAAPIVGGIITSHET